MKVWLGEGDENFLFQLTPETVEETCQLVRLASRAKRVNGQKIAVFSVGASNSPLGELILPLNKNSAGNYVSVPESRP